MGPSPGPRSNRRSATVAECALRCGSFEAPLGLRDPAGWPVGTREGDPLEDDSGPVFFFRHPAGYPSGRVSGRIP